MTSQTIPYNSESALPLTTENIINVFDVIKAIPNILHKLQEDIISTEKNSDLYTEKILSLENEIEKSVLLKTFFYKINVLT